MLSSWLKGDMDALKGIREAPTRGNEALKGDGKVLNCDGMP